MNRIKGITVTLIQKVEGDRDEFNHPTYTEKRIDVENVLVSPTSSNDILNNTSLDGHTLSYSLAIPKSDTNDWTDAIVEFYDRKWHVIGIPLVGIDAMIPLEWNKKVTVEAYE